MIFYFTAFGGVLLGLSIGHLQKFDLWGKTGLGRKIVLRLVMTARCVDRLKATVLSFLDHVSQSERSERSKLDLSTKSEETTN